MSYLPNQTIDVDGVSRRVLWAEEIGEGRWALALDGPAPVGASINGLGMVVEKELNDPEAPFAGLFFCRDENLALEEEDYPLQVGWQPVEMGWNVPFQAGLSPFGRLRTLNENLPQGEAIGTTDTTGSNGAPLALKQNVEISNAQTQVNGWKTSTSRDTYALTPAAVRNVDGEYVYAEAHMIWSGNSDTITQRGISTNTLEAYQATATVGVTIDE